MARKILLFALVWIMSSASTGSADVATVWFGTRGDAKGIYRATLAMDSGKLSEAELAAEIDSPGFLCVNSGGTLLYTLGRVPGTEGNVAVFTIGNDRKSLTFLGSADSGCGKSTHLSLSQDEKTLLLAHYGGGAVAALPIADDGRILPPTTTIHHQGSSIDKQRQERAHPHWIGPAPGNRYVMVPDLGTDEVVIYRFDEDQHSLQRHGAARIPPGSGPRHMKFHPNGKWAYVLNELGLSVTAMRFDAAAGSLDAFQNAVALPRTERKDILTLGSEIRMHPSGKFVYAGIRGHDVIAVFEIDQQTGTLSLIEREPVRGSWPRNFGIDPSGKWLLAAGAESSTVAVFGIDQRSGRLTFTRQVISVPEAICVEFQADL